jgi:hypothetical protein
MAAIKEESPRSVPPMIVPRALSAKVIIVGGNEKDFWDFLGTGNSTSGTKII